MRWGTPQRLQGEENCHFEDVVLSKGGALDITTLRDVASPTSVNIRTLPLSRR